MKRLVTASKSLSLANTLELEPLMRCIWIWMRVNRRPFAPRAPSRPLPVLDPFLIQRSSFSRDFDWTRAWVFCEASRVLSFGQIISDFGLQNQTW